MEQKCLNPNNQKTLSGSPKSKCFLGKRKSKGVDGCFRYKAETELNVLCSDVVEANTQNPNTSRRSDLHCLVDQHKPKTKNVLLRWGIRRDTVVMMAKMNIMPIGRD